MSYTRDQTQRAGTSQPSSHQQHLDTTSPSNSRFQRQQQPTSSSAQSSGPYSAPFTSPSHLPDRIYIPTRASTVDSPNDFGRNNNINNNGLASHPDYGQNARSEDLNHGNPARLTDPNNGPGSLPTPSPAFMSSSRPTTPGSSSNQHQRSRASSSGHSGESERRLSMTSHSSVSSQSQSQSQSQLGGATGKGSGTQSVNTAHSIASSICSACGNPMQGAFVRALGTMFHLNCFKCMDCGDVVASKFFPVEGSDGKQHPLCERDYFRRLNLICAKCNMALRGSYITACNKKYHVEHFTCSLCSILFGPQDSYYEHEGDVYCHFHYSTRFATKCAGCSSAILKQFVEINRNMRDECWHPECYMINKFWNVKIVSRRPNSPSVTGCDAPEPAYAEEEQRETHASLKDKQIKMEQQVYRIWTVLSAFEESSAACISDMLRQVSNGQYIDAIRMAEKFILHVEVLFAAIDDLEYHFAWLNMKGMSHVREARLLCRKTVDLFTLLSHTQETGSRRMGMTQELLALVTGLAHYLKILIRIALTGALKLEREQSVREAMASFLDKLHLLAVQGGDPTARRVIKGAEVSVQGQQQGQQEKGNTGTMGVTYGFRSLAPESAGESPFTASASSSSRDPGTTNTATKVSVNNPPSDLCVKCDLTVEEDCVRLGTYQRWHSHCIQCMTCGKVAAVLTAKELAPPKNNNPDEKEKEKDKGDKEMPKLSTARRPPANVDLFVYEADTTKDTASFGDVPTVIFCTDHSHQGCRSGFQSVSRLEQYAFLLNVALRRLYLLLKKQGVVPLSPVATTTPRQSDGEQQDPYRNSGDIMRMKSVHLDRKLSATARLPKRSTIVESPTGKSVHPSDVLRTERSQELGVSQQPQQRPNVVQQQQLQQQAQLSSGRSPPGQHTPLANQPRGLGPPVDTSQVIRPSFTKNNNTEVMIVDDSGPNSPAIGSEEPPPTSAPDEGITLADIPQLMEAAQAREQRRSLPRQSSIPHIAELSPLELAIVKHCAVLTLHRSPLRDQFDLDEILELVEVKKGGFWNKLFKGGNDKKNVKKKGVFGVPLELLVEREGADSLLGATRSTLRIPSFIDDVVSAMRQMDMSIEGIFRKNGNIRRLKELTEVIDRDASTVDLSSDNPVQLAALLKKFLRDLPDPLMTFKLHRLYIASQNLTQDEDRKRMLHMVSLLLPKAHRDTMEVIFVFLKWVASFSHLDAETGSKMDLSNLATVICPSILYSRGRDAVRDESFGAIRVVTSLLENQDEFFTVPADFLPILSDQEYFSNSMELPGKEFMKKCDIYMRFRATGRPLMSPPLSSSPYSGSQRFQPSDSRERPPIGSPPPSDPYLRNGRHQSPPSHPPLPTSLPQGVSMIQSPQFRNNQPLDSSWQSPRAANNGSSSSRPNSYSSPAAGDSTSLFGSPNGHPAAVRQRI